MSQALKGIAQCMTNLRGIHPNNGEKGSQRNYTLFGGDDNHHIEASNSSNPVPPLVKQVISIPLVPKLLEEPKDKKIEAR